MMVLAWMLLVIVAILTSRYKDILPGEKLFGANKWSQVRNGREKTFGTKVWFQVRDAREKAVGNQSLVPDKKLKTFWEPGKK